MRQSKKIKLGIIFSIVCIGLIMRAPITTPPLIIEQLASVLHVSIGSLGILTTIPMLMFVVFSSIAPISMQYLGLKNATLIAVGLTVFGGVLRLIPTMTMIILGTILIGIGIAHLNIFMPSLVSAYFVNNIGLYTTLYTFSMFFGNMFFNLITQPIASNFGWQMVLIILMVPSLISFIGWGIIKRFLPKDEVKIKKVINIPEKKMKSMWLNKKAWLFLIMFGGQSIFSYTYSAWMPSLMRFHKVNSNLIGVLTANFALIGLLIALFLPRLITKLDKKGLFYITLVVDLCGLSAAFMLFFQNTNSTFFWLIQSVLMGIVVGFFFVNVMTMFVLKTDNPIKTVRLSSMAQTGGYLMASMGPLFYGLAFSINPTGLMQIVIELILLVILIIVSFVTIKIDKV